MHELDSFLYVNGWDLNGAQLGTAGQLSRDGSLPTGLAFYFSSAVSSNQQDAVLTYTFTNTSASTFSDLRFFVLLDAEIDAPTNTFFNEFGVPEGSPGRGAGDAAPDQWQIDEPGFQTGTLLRNIFLGALSDLNSVHQTAPNDVAMSLGFLLGNLKSGQGTSIEIMISEGTNLLGGFALVQHDSATTSTTTITFSGSATTNQFPITDMTAIAQLGFGQWQINRAMGTLIGNVIITNPSTSGVALGPPFQLGLAPSASFYLPHPAGNLNDGIPYLDLTAVVSAQVPSGLIVPGQTVVLTNAIEVYSLTRSPPVSGLFEFWATPQ